MSLILLDSSGNIKLDASGNIRVGADSDPCCCCETCVDSTWDVTITGAEIQGNIPETDASPHLYQEGNDGTGGTLKCWGDSSFSGTLSTGTGAYSVVGGVKWANWYTPYANGATTDVRVEHYPSGGGMVESDARLVLRIAYNCSTKVFGFHVALQDTSSLACGRIFYGSASSPNGDCAVLDGLSIPLSYDLTGCLWGCGGFAGTAILTLNPLP